MVDALIKFTGTVTGAGPDGEALLGAIGETVTVANVDDTDVDKWQFEILYSPPGSAITRGIKQAYSTTPDWDFVPDVSECYLVRLRVKDVNGVESVDDRAFGILETNGRLRPPGRATRSSVNFGGQDDGWWFFFRQYLVAIDAVVGGASTPGGADTNVQFNDVGVLAGSANFTFDKTERSLAIGAGATALGTTGAQAMGDGATAGGAGAIALGFNASASAASAVAIGQNADASAQGATALSSGDASAELSLASGDQGFATRWAGHAIGSGKNGPSAIGSSSQSERYQVFGVSASAVPVTLQDNGTAELTLANNKAYIISVHAVAINRTSGKWTSFVREILAHGTGGAAVIDDEFVVRDDPSATGWVLAFTTPAGLTLRATFTGEAVADPTDILVRYDISEVFGTT